MSSSIEASNVAVVRRYFDGCQSGDLQVLLGTLAPDVVHYFLPHQFPPIRGAEHLARHWRSSKQAPSDLGDRSHHRADRRGGERVELHLDTQGYVKADHDRGSEWYVLRDGLIAEIRAYLVHDDMADTELTQFPYRERGYLTK